jgi:hypothetical protein
MKKITFEHEGQLYTLEYTRKSIEMMERTGFRIVDVQSRPMTVLPEMFYGAFLANHKGIKRRTVDEIFERFDDKSTLIEKLAAMYAEPMEALFDGDNVAETEKVSWDANF